MRSMLGEIQAALDEAYPDAARMHDDPALLLACMRGEASCEGYHDGWAGHTCAACLIAAHAEAQVAGGAMVRHRQSGERMALAQAVNRTIREARLPLPLVPEPDAP